MSFESTAEGQVGVDGADRRRKTVPHVGTADRESPSSELGRTVNVELRCLQGKFIRINFDASGYIAGANIESCIL